MITVDYRRGRGVPRNSKNDYVILEQPLMVLLEKFFMVSFSKKTIEHKFNFIL